MPIGEICNRDVVVVQRDDTVLQAAKIMRQYHVGNVVVVKEHNNVRTPLGIVTDRDIVMEVVATGLDPAVITVGDIMVPELASVEESCGLLEAIQYMRGKAVRRLPVVGENGRLIGIVTLDDLLVLLAEEFGALAKLVAREQEKEASNRR